MSGWKAAGAIIAFELRREWTGILMTAAFAIYFGAVFNSTVSEAADQPVTGQILSGARDWIYLFGFTVFGCMMNRTIFGYWRDDPFSRRIAHWRTMPIPIAAIVKARYLQSLIVLAIAGTLYVSLQYAVDPKLRQEAGLSAWVATSLIWMAYGFIVQIGYIFLELGCAGKTFVKWYLSYGFLLMAICLFTAWQHFSLFEHVLDAAREQKLLWPAVAIAIAAVAAWFGSGLTLRRMRARRYTF